MPKVSINVDNIPYILEINNQVVWGDSTECILDNDEDLTKNTDFENTGNVVTKFLSDIECKKISDTLKNILCDKLFEILNIKILPSELKNYHKFVTKEQHLKFTSMLYTSDGCGFNSSDYINNFYKEIDNRVSELCGLQVESKIPGRINSEFWIRIVRPVEYTNCFDNNPPHRDISIKRLRNALNLYFPLIGSGKESSLGIIPGSHRWKECEIQRTANGTHIGDNKFNVLCVTDTKFGGVNIERPFINKGEFLLFSPYCIHGGAPNFSDLTRISLEMRFWKNSS